MGGGSLRKPKYSDSSNEYLIARYVYLKRKSVFYTIMIDLIKRLQVENIKCVECVESAEAVLKVVEEQLSKINITLHLLIEELDKRGLAIEKLSFEKLKQQHLPRGEQ
ncbi:MAG: hypothetical protein OH337_04200 [Candidatus Parvarchaeota archaeon]|nr:hypothetical protein [Candidatus Haiyanarchaeum thermophilum]